MKVALFTWYLQKNVYQEDKLIFDLQNGLFHWKYPIFYDLNQEVHKSKSIEFHLQHYEILRLSSQIYKIFFDYSKLFKNTRFLQLLKLRISWDQTDKYLGVFAKLRVIEKVAYNFKTLGHILSFSNFKRKILD